jgi:hypothetical protein
VDFANVLLVILLVAACAVCAAAIWALRESVVAMRALTSLATDTRERLNPLLEKADVTVDVVNAEILRVDGVITRFEEASERVSSASGTISGIVNAPAGIVSDVALRMRRAWKERQRGDSHEGAGVDRADE